MWFIYKLYYSFFAVPLESTFRGVSCPFAKYVYQMSVYLDKEVICNKNGMSEATIIDDVITLKGCQVYRKQS